MRDHKEGRGCGFWPVGLSGWLKTTDAVVASANYVTPFPITTNHLTVAKSRLPYWRGKQNKTSSEEARGGWDGR